MARSLLIGLPIRRFVRLDIGRRRLLVEAAVCLLAARLALVFVPFPRLARRLGTFMSPADDRVRDARSPASHRHGQLAEEIGWAVTRAARHVPFRAACLPQAMAARMMLRRRRVSSVLHFGAKRSERNLFDAHAWLEAAGVEVTGYPQAKEAVEVACFI